MRSKSAFWLAAGLVVGVAAARPAAAEGTNAGLPVVVVLQGDTQASEPGTNTGHVLISRQATGTVSLVVHYRLAGTASNGVDYELLPGTVTIPAGAVGVPVYVRPIDDALPEPTERADIILVTGSGYAIGSPSVGSVHIEDNDGFTNAPPAPLVVTVGVLDPHAAEQGRKPGLVRFCRSGGDMAAPLDVAYRVGGTASNGVDYDFLPGMIVIPGGTNCAVLPVVPVDDALPETEETVVLSLLPPATSTTANASSATVVILDNDRSNNAPPTVRIVVPTNGAAFAAPATIGVHAEATDADGQVVRVEFYANDRWLGSDTTAPYTTVWTNVGPGLYALRAKAVDQLGACGVSAPVNISVTDGATPLPVVTFQPVAPCAAEQGPRTGLVAVCRTGDLTESLRVFIAVGGTATPGADYAELPHSIVIPAAAPHALIEVRPVDDLLPEPLETVCLEIVTNALYVRGSARTAVVTIEDNDRTNLPPVVRLLTPTNGSVFIHPANVPLHAEAADPEGALARVDFFAGDMPIGSDASAPYVSVWSNPPPGWYTLSARATDHQGKSGWSSPVRIAVVSPQPKLAAVRHLPVWYVPGVRLPVLIKIEPGQGVPGYTVRDRPPAGWGVGLVGPEGAVDGAEVVFGPFTNGLPRLLRYEAIPAADADGVQRFAGVVIAGDRTNAIPRVNEIGPVPPHPADAAPTDWALTADEVDAYTEAWRGGRLAVRPNPIPVNFLTRAGFLWLMGEAYEVSTNVPTPCPPLVWVPAAVGEPGLPPPADGTPHSTPGWTSNGYGAAQGDLPTNALPGVPLVVMIAIHPPERTRAWAVQDRPPAGWHVGPISDEGVYCPLTRTVKWGLFTNPVPRTLTYVITPPAVLRPENGFCGVASFDGINVPIIGHRIIRPAGGAIAAAAAEGGATLADEGDLVQFYGEPGFRYWLEASSDLVEWTVLDELLNSDGILQYLDPDRDAYDLRFYRIEPVE